MTGRDSGRMDLSAIYEEDEDDLIWNVNIRASRLESISRRINIYRKYQPPIRCWRVRLDIDSFDYSCEGFLHSQNRSFSGSKV